VKVFRTVAEVPDGFGPSAVTIGKFDGVHSGHRARSRPTVGSRRPS
jgi:riboflavin kinase / FMN adenylyltransferase